MTISLAVHALTVRRVSVYAPLTMKLTLAVSCLGLILAATACGGGGGSSISSTPPTGTTAAPVYVIGKLRQHLVAKGYTVDAIPRQQHQPYAQAITVPDVDWASSHTFDVDMYVFPSAAAAERYVKTVIKPAPTAPGSSWKRVGSVLFEAATTEVPGAVQCTLVNGSPNCSPPPNVPPRDFLNVVEAASGQRLSD